MMDMELRKLKSVLSFEHFDVLETIYKCNPFKEDENKELSPIFKLDIKYNDSKKSEAALILSIELGDNELNEFVFYLRAVIVGVFSLEIDENEENKEKLIEDMYKKNSVAILYPYLRSIVTDISSKGSKEPIMLPTINIAAMMEREDLITETFGD